MRERQLETCDYCLEGSKIGKLAMYRDVARAKAWSYTMGHEHMYVCGKCLEDAGHLLTTEVNGEADDLCKAQPMQAKPSEELGTKVPKKKPGRPKKYKPVPYSQKTLHDAPSAKPYHYMEEYEPLNERPAEMIYARADYAMWEDNHRQAYWEVMVDLALSTKDKALFNIATKHLQKIKYKQGELTQ